MEFRLLGQLEVLDGSREIPLGPGKRRALLTLLLLHRNEVVPAERLIDELWDGRPPATAAKGLQVQISRLRKDLVAGGGNGMALCTRSHGYVLEVPPDSVDVARFERALADGERALADGRPDHAAVRLREGLKLWRGPPLVDFTYEAFAQDEIARLEELRLMALERRIDADLALGRHREVVVELETLLRTHALREGLRGQLMLALHRCGRQADALEVYRDGRRHAVEELGLEPGRELRDLQAQILAGSPELAAPRTTQLRAERAARRAPLAILAAGVLLGAAAVAALLRSIDPGPAHRPPIVQVAANGAMALDAGGRKAMFLVPLPGRPTDAAALGDRLFVVSVNSSALTVVDARSRGITRTVPLAMKPGAVAAGPEGVWIADGQRGLLTRLVAGYEAVATRVTWRRHGIRVANGLSRLDPIRVAVADGSAWLTDGSRTLVRADTRGHVARVTAPYRLDGITAGADALWAISTRQSAVLRIDPRRRRITDVIRIVTRPGSGAPAPVALTATRDAVWVLNANTATVSRIDPRQRGVVGTVRLGLEQSPRDIAAGAGAVWVANFDGSLTRIPTAGGPLGSSSIRGSLVGVAGSGNRLWLTGTALDRQLPGGAG
jgi:DNA-binding SARP family transcriptional activator/streptogramin lyase